MWVHYNILSSKYIFKKEIYQQKFNKKPKLIEGIAENNQHLSKRVIRHAFGDYGYGLGSPHSGDEIAPQPSKVRIIHFEIN